MVIAEEAEDPVPLQRPVATHDEPALPRLSLFLWGRELRVTEGDRGGSEAGRGTSGPKCGDTCSPSVLSLLAGGPRRSSSSHCWIALFCRISSSGTSRTRGGHGGWRWLFPWRAHSQAAPRHRRVSAQGSGDFF